MDQDLAQIIYYAVAGAFAAVFIKFMMGRTGGKHAKRLMALGLKEKKSPVPIWQQFFKAPGSRFKGTYDGCYAGYNQGNKAKFRAIQSIQTNRFGTSYTAGFEYWADAVAKKAPKGNPSVSVHERKYPMTDVAPMPKKEIQTGDPEFDNRFAVHCDDIDWTLKVLNPNVRASIMALPVACFFITGARAYYTLAFTPNAGKALMPRGGFMTSKNLWTDRPELFLDAVAALAKSAKAANDSSLSNVH